MARTAAKLRSALLYVGGFVLLVALGTILIIFVALAFTNLGTFELTVSVFSLLVLRLLALSLLAAVLLITEAPSDKDWPLSILELR